MISHHPIVYQALETLALEDLATDDAAGWALGIRSMECWCSYERAAMRALALALVTGDEARAQRAAIWISDPSAAMDAALVDARFARPAHHVADEGQVLTLTADGTVSQAPVPVGDAE